MLATVGDTERVDLVLALEIMDDDISENISLFLPPHAYFSDMLSVYLCPAVHELLGVCRDRSSLKALFGLIAILIRGF